MHNKISLNLIALSFVFGATQAHSNVEPNADGWRCATVNDWQISQIVIEQELVLNNFVIRERSSFMSNSLRVLEVSFSVTNRSRQPISLNTQVVGFSEGGNIKFAVTVDPLFDIVSEQRTETVTGDTYVNPSNNVLGETASLCFNIVTDI